MFMENRRPLKSAFSARGLDQPNILLLADIADVFDGTNIGNEGVNLGYMADPDRRGALEFGQIRHEDDVPGIGYNRLRDFHFAIIEIQKRTIVIDRGRTDNRVIHLELANEIDGCLTDDTAIGTAHHAPAITTSIEG